MRLRPNRRPARGPNLRRALCLSPLLLVAALASCRSFPGHPVLLSAPRLPAQAAPSVAGGVPEPGEVPEDKLALRLFDELQGIFTPLVELRARGRSAGREPRFERLKAMERSVRKRYTRGGFGGRVRSVVVLGVTGRVPLAPAAMARLMMDPEVERAAMGADVFRALETVHHLPRSQRRRYRVELLRRGEGPFRFDLRFTCAIEGVTTRDGSVLMRYDPALLPRPEHISLFRGGCLLEADGAGGTFVTEILILGTDIRLLPPLQSKLTGLVLETMRDRATRLWARAWAGR